MILIYKNKILCHVRSSTITNPNKFACPGGSVDKGEDPKKSAVRELYEESQIKINKNNIKLLYKNRHTAFYYAILKSKPRVPGPLPKFRYEVSKKKQNIGEYAGGYHYFLDSNDIKKLGSKFFRPNLNAVKLLIANNIIT